MLLIIADGSSVTAVYDAEGNLISSRDAAGQETRIDYDKLNRAVRVIKPDGTSTAEEFDALGRKTAVVDERGNRTTFVYDYDGVFVPIADLAGAAEVQNRPAAVVDADGETTTFAYDRNGNVIGILDAEGNLRQAEYDALNRITKTVFADGSFSTAAYDAVGRLKEETDPAGRTRRIEYDAAGRVLKVTDPLGGLTHFTYDEFGNKLSQTDANGRTTRWEYNSAGDVVKRTLPLGMSETFTYDALGQLASHHDFDDKLSTYTYDDLRRLLNTTYADGSQVAVTYTSEGLRDTVTDGRGVTDFDYDSEGRLTRVLHPGGSTIAYAYDLAGNVHTVTTSTGTTSYHYDDLNRLDSVIDLDGGQTSYVYDDAGRLALVTYPNGETTSYTYNELSQITGMETRRSDATLIARYTITYDDGGRRSRVVDDQGRTVDYMHDALGRLVQERITDSTAGTLTIDYTYDAVGNRLTRTDAVGTTTYTYDANDRLATAGTVSYVYDANGNLVSQTDGSGTMTYGYDFADRLISLQSPTGTSTYQYDADGVRVGAVVDNVATTYLVDTNRPFSEVLEERDAAGVPVAVYTHGLDLISQHSAGGTHYYHYDAQQSVRQLTDASQVVTDRYDYDAFGNLLRQIGTTPNDYLYTGERFDADQGAYHLRARQYDPAVGRFTTMDPFEGLAADPLTLNKYLYANADPVDYIDPSGEFLLGLSFLALFNAFTLGFGLGAAIHATDNTAQTTNLITSGGPPNSSVYGRNVSVSFGGFGSIVFAGSLEGLYIEEQESWAGYVSLGWGMSLGYSILTPLPVFFPFGVGTTLAAGPVYNIHKPADYTGPYIISSYFYGLLAGASISLFRSPDDSTYGFEAGFGVDLSIASISITRQEYKLAQGITDALKAAPLPKPPRATDPGAVFSYLLMHKDAIDRALGGS